MWPNDDLSSSANLNWQLYVMLVPSLPVDRVGCDCACVQGSCSRASLKYLEVSKEHYPTFTDFLAFTDFLGIVISLHNRVQPKGNCGIRQGSGFLEIYKLHME